MKGLNILMIAVVSLLTALIVQVGAQLPQLSTVGAITAGNCASFASPTQVQDAGAPCVQTGSWTPQLTGSTSGNWTNTTASGSYEKVGRSVILRGTISLATSNSPVGNAQISGLPFTATATANDNGACPFVYLNGFANSVNYTAFAGVILPSSGNQISIFELGSGQGSQSAVVARIGVNPQVIFMCSYHT